MKQIQTVYDHIHRNNLKTIVLVALFPILFISLIFLFTWIVVPIDQALQTTAQVAIPTIIACMAWMLISWAFGDTMMLNSAKAHEINADNPENKENTIADLQVVSWILSNFSTIEQVKNAISGINIVQLDPRASTVHWRITENTGKQVILEIVNGKPTFYDSKLGVLTNSPGYEWQIHNLNNYVNLIPGTAGPIKMGDVTLSAFGAGSGFLGLPGDFTPPSRFIRAAFFQTYSIQQETGYDAAMDAFHILNNFDVPLGTEFPVGKAPVNMPSATQWTIATDLTNRMIYYHTMYNRTIRSIDMDKIDFANIEYQYYPLDKTKAETIIPVEIN